jgi:hypothetical protein
VLAGESIEVIDHDPLNGARPDQLAQLQQGGSF